MTAAMHPDAFDPERITGPTLAHYGERAEAFRDGTRDHDVTQNIAALLRALDAPDAADGDPARAPVMRLILDFGCGPGRDLRTFARLGHRAIGLDGVLQFVEMARRDSGCEVWHQDFLHLNLPDAYFDGIFANASLFHVPSRELPRVLRQLFATLKPGGALFSSNPRGNNQEGWHAGRYGAYHELSAWQAWMTQAGFIEIEHYYRPAGLPREQQPWLASVWRKGQS
ncbi:MAG: methyltransferase domain protein [Herbaspirillum sp.]|jgi:SAM-dependent methyltransferase|nr:methyltransferase domain protein [Herbaspirillum sp.]